MADYIKRASHKHASAFIASAGQTVPVHKSTAHTAIELPGAITKVESAIADAVLALTTTTRVQVRLGDIQYLGAMMLRVSLAAPAGGGSYQPFVGLNIIRNMRVLFGSEVLAEYENYNAVLKAFLRYVPIHSAEAYLDAMGSATGSTAATSVVIPLVVPWGVTHGQTEGTQEFLPLHKMRGNISLEITFNSANTAAAGVQLATTVFVANPLTACSLVYMEATFHDSAVIDGADEPFALYAREFISYPEFVTGGAITNNRQDVSGLTGNIESLHVFSTSAATFNGVACSSYSNGSDLWVPRVDLDGRQYWVGFSKTEHSGEVAVLGFGRVHLDSTILQAQGAPVIPFAMFPRSHGFSGGLPTQDLRNLSVFLTSTNAGAVQIVAVGSIMLVKEGNKIVRRRV